MEEVKWEFSVSFPKWWATLCLPQIGINAPKKIFSGIYGWAQWPWLFFPSDFPKWFSDPVICRCPSEKNKQHQEQERAKKNKTFSQFFLSLHPFASEELSQWEIQLLVHGKVNISLTAEKLLEIKPFRVRLLSSAPQTPRVGGIKLPLTLLAAFPPSECLKTCLKGAETRTL